MDPALWRQVAASARTAFSAAHAGLGVTDPQGGLVLYAKSHELIQQALVRPCYLPEKNPGVAFVAATAPMTVAGREQLISDRDLERLDFYHGAMRPFDFWHAAMVNLHRDETLLAPMGLLRTRKEPPFGEAEFRGLRHLAPHLNRAIRVNLRLLEMDAQARAAADMADRALVALALTDARGRVAEANAPARAILAENDGLGIRDGALRPGRAEDCARLARLIAEAAGGSRFVRMSGVMQVWRPSGRRPLSLVVTPTHNAGSPFGRSQTVSVAFADPERAPETDANLLARLYGLTAREASVAVLFLRGRPPCEAAAELGMTENTARTHVRPICSRRLGSSGSTIWCAC